MIICHDHTLYIKDLKKVKALQKKGSSAIFKANLDGFAANQALEFL